jgi:hypothetical protein
MIQISPETNSLISDLNEKLKEKCTELKLTIDSSPGEGTFKLCLLNNNECVSYLIINNENDTFNILSRTDDEYRRRGYNKFLTAVSICLADTMTASEYLFSSTNVEARIRILKEYKHMLKDELDRLNDELDRLNDELDRLNDELDRLNDEGKDGDSLKDKIYKLKDEIDMLKKSEPLNFFVPIAENKNKAEDIITIWINNCDKGRAGGTRRKTQRRKNKTQKRKSKKTQRRKNKTQRHQKRNT